MSNTFIKDAIRTESPDYYQQNTRVLHAAIGLVTESGELIDAIKKASFYGKELDVTNIKEEAGDILWYLAILFDELDTDFETEQARVIAKLKARFPDKFTEDKAFNRDLSKERKVLEQQHSCEDCVHNVADYCTKHAEPAIDVCDGYYERT